MKKLMVLLALFSFTATASDWTLDGNSAETNELTGYPTTARLFINTDSEASIGFVVYDTECKNFETEIHVSALHLVNDQPIKFQNQCVGRSKKLFMPRYELGSKFVIDQFTRSETVSVSTVGSNYVLKYSAMGFSKAYEAVDAVARLTKRAI